MPPLGRGGRTNTSTRPTNRPSTTTGAVGIGDTASADVRRRRPNADSAVSRTIGGSGPPVFENILSREATNTIHPTWSSLRERISRLEVGTQIGVLPAAQNVRHIGRHLRRQHRPPEHIERELRAVSCARMMPWVMRTTTTNATNVMPIRQ